MELFETEIREISRNVWMTVLGLPIRPIADANLPMPAGVPLVASRIGIDGGWQGVMTVTGSEPIARKVASVIFGLTEEQVSMDQMLDAWKELVNITGGNFKALLPGVCTMSLPTADVGERVFDDVAGDYGTVSSIAFECEGSVVSVSIEQKSPPDRSRQARQKLH